MVVVVVVVVKTVVVAETAGGPCAVALAEPNSCMLCVRQRTTCTHYCHECYTTTCSSNSSSRLLGRLAGFSSQQDRCVHQGKLKTSMCMSARALACVRVQCACVLACACSAVESSRLRLRPDVVTGASECVNVKQVKAVGPLAEGLLRAVWCVCVVEWCLLGDLWLVYSKEASPIWCA